MSMGMLYISAIAKIGAGKSVPSRMVTWVQAQSNAKPPTYCSAAGKSRLPGNCTGRAASIRRVGLSGDRFIHAKWFWSPVVEP